MIDADVLVVGAGPAGCAAAITAARHGLDVMVVDKAVFPRQKICGDGLTASCLRQLARLGVDHARVPNWLEVTEIAIRAPGGREAVLSLPHTGAYAAVAPRSELDAALVALARSTGVTVHEGCAFDSFVAPDAHDGARLVVRVENLGEVRVRHVVAADGMWSPVRRALGLNEPGYLGEWHAFRQYARGVTGPAAERMYVWFDADLLPGYAWSFPLPNGRANIGFGLLRTPGQSLASMKTLWPELLRRPHLVEALGEDFEPEGRHQAWPIPARVDRATLAIGQVLFVGDAAMAADVLTGEGIGQALTTGIAAGDAIAERGRTGRRADVRTFDAAERYRRALRRELVADHRMSAALGRLIARPRAVDAGIRLVDTNDWTRRTFARWMFEDEPRAIACTPRRWHRSMFHRPGATFTPPGDAANVPLE